MALGVYVTFRVLDLADLTCEGSFPLGAATAATLMATRSRNYQELCKGQLPREYYHKDREGALWI